MAYSAYLYKLKETFKFFILQIRRPQGLMEIVLSKNFGLYVADYYFFSVLELNDSCVILVTG